MEKDVTHLSFHRILKTVKSESHSEGYYDRVKGFHTSDIRPRELTENFVSFQMIYSLGLHSHLISANVLE